MQQRGRLKIEKTMQNHKADMIAESGRSFGHRHPHLVFFASMANAQYHESPESFNAFLENTFQRLALG